MRNDNLVFVFASELCHACLRISSQTRGVFMRYTLAFLAAIALTAPARAQKGIRVDDLSHHPFVADFPSGGQLNLLIRSAEIHIVGHEKHELAVRVGGGDGSESTDINATYDRSGNAADLSVSGGPHNDVVIAVEVPRQSNLVVRVPAGDVDIDGIVGDKEISLHAGDLRIAVGDPADYALVKASVTSGDINAAPFHEFHGGLFRSFEKTGPGNYKLIVHLWAGDIVLK
jgi:hypothetical protein